MTHTRSFLKTTTFALAVAGLSLAAPLNAQAITTNQIEVEFDRKYLETDWGVELVYKKFESRAEAACARTGARSFSDRALEEACEAKLMEDFIRDAKSDKLKAYHIQMTT